MSIKRNFRSLEITAKKYLNTYSSGIHATQLKDSLIEVDIVREYQPGDKRLDSRSSLKIGKMMSRVFNPERSLSVFIIIDLSASSFGILDNAIITGLYLTYLAELNGEKVGLCVFSDKVDCLLPPSDDYSSVLIALERAYSSKGAKTNIGRALLAVANLGLSNALFVLISDFYFNFEISNALRSMSLVESNVFLALALVDERDWIDVGLPFYVSAVDVETGSRQKIDLSGKKDYNGWIEDLKKNLRRARCDFVKLGIEGDFLLPLVRYLI